MDEWIELADETKVEDAYVVNLDRTNIAIYVNGVHTFSEMYAWFGSAETTSHIHSYQYGDEQDWNGYTETIGIQISEEYSIASLRKN